MNMCDLNPFIRYIREHKYADYRYYKGESICYDCRLFFMNNGEGSVVVDGTEYEFSKKTAIYFPPGTRYLFKLRQSEEVSVFVFNFDLISKFSHIESSLGTATERDYNPEKSPKYDIHEIFSKPIIKLIPKIESLVKGCSDNFLTKNNFYRESASALLKLCLIEMLSHNSDYSSLCEKVLNYVHENYNNTNLTNKLLSDKFGYHPYHLSRIIKQETGQSLHKYIISYRLHIAKNFLITTRYDIEEIAWRCGFGSAAYFVKTFREQTGITPKKYREHKMHTEL